MLEDLNCVHHDFLLTAVSVLLDVIMYKIQKDTISIPYLMENFLRHIHKILSSIFHVSSVQYSSGYSQKSARPIHRLARTPKSATAQSSCMKASPYPSLPYFLPTQTLSPQSRFLNVLFIIPSSRSMSAMIKATL